MHVCAIMCIIMNNKTGVEGNEECAVRIDGSGVADRRWRGASMEDRFLTIEETAEQLRCHVDTIRRMVRRGELRAYRLRGRGRRLLFKESDVQAAVEPVEPEEVAQ